MNDTMNFPRTNTAPLSRLPVLLMLLVLGGCVGGRSASPDYQLLTAKTPATTTQALAGKTIGVGPVHVAQFLNRPQIVVHGGGSAMQLRDGQRWGEPLEQGVQRVLLQNLAAMTGAQTRNFPWRQSAVPDYALRIDIIDLDQLSDGSTLLDVNWLLEDLKNGRAIKSGQQHITTAAGIAEQSQLAAAYSGLFAQLAQQVAAILIADQSVMEKAAQ